IPFAFERIERTPNTLDAHRLIGLAGKEGVQGAVVEALFRAYFTEGRDIGTPQALLDVVAETALDRGRLRPSSTATTAWRRLGTPRNWLGACEWRACRSSSSMRRSPCPAPNHPRRFWRRSGKPSPKTKADLPRRDGACASAGPRQRFGAGGPQPRRDHRASSPPEMEATFRARGVSRNTCRNKANRSSRSFFTASLCATAGSASTMARRASTS